MVKKDENINKIITEPKLFNHALYKNEIIRLYNEGGLDPFDLLYSELSIWFQLAESQKWNFFMFETVPAHDMVFETNDFEYAALSWKEHYNIPKDYVFSKTTHFIKENLCIDHLVFEKLKHVDFVFLIPKLDSNKLFHYTLILGLYDSNDLSFIKIFNSNLIKIDNIINLSQTFLDISAVRRIFNCENTIFKEYRKKKYELELIGNDDIYHNSKEYLEFKKFADYYLALPWRTDEHWAFKKSLKPEWDRLNALKNEKSKSLVNHRLNNDIEYKALCSKFIIYTNNIWGFATESPKYENFWMDSENCCFTDFCAPENVSSTKTTSSGVLKIDAELLPYGLFDIIHNNEEFFYMDLSTLKKNPDELNIK